MTATIDPVRADRRSLLYIVLAFGAAAAWVLGNGVLRFWAGMTRGMVTLELRPPFQAAATEAPDGTLQQPVDVLRVAVDASQLSQAAVGWLRAAEVLSMVGWVVLFVLAAPAIASLIGTNMAITDLGYGAFGEPGARPSAAASADAWIAFLAVLFVSGLQVAFRGASRLARDQEGII
jgi:hypothetical protein